MYSWRYIELPFHDKPNSRAIIPIFYREKFRKKKKKSSKRKLKMRRKGRKTGIRENPINAGWILLNND